MIRLFSITLIILFSSSNIFSQYMVMQNPDRRWEDSGVILTSNIYSVIDKGAYSEVNSYLSFKSDRPSEFNSDTQIELVAYFQLPEDYEISDLWLWVGDEIMEAKMYDRWTAERIYEGIVNRRKDPAIIYKNGDGWYELRIYPFKREEIRRIKITYLVPNLISSTNKSITLPNQIQKITSSIEGETGFLIYTNLEKENVTIPGKDEIVFESDSINSDPFLRSNITAETNTSQYTIQLKQSIDSLVVSTYSDNDENFFEIYLNPLDLVNDEESNEVLLLIDYKSENTDLSVDDILSTIKNGIQTYLEEDDKVNVFFSGLNTIKMSENWVSVNKTAIDSLFSSFNRIEEIGFSNLDRLLTDAYDYFSESNSSGSLLLISSSQVYNGVDDANTLLEALNSYTDGNLPKTFISDIQSKNYQYEWRNGRQYRGNEYLYLNLTRDTRGELFDYNDTNNESSRIKSGFEGVIGTITDLEVYPQVNGGFSYSRFTPSELNNSWSGPNFYQIGKYTGGFPISFQVSGFYNGDIFSKNIEIQEEDIAETDSTLKRIWSAHKIKQLEQGISTNENISEIINLSLDNRILSQYTSFLALEPSDTIFACVTCFDETRLISLEEEDYPDKFEIDSLIAYPNPFNPTVNFEIEVSEEWNPTNSSIKIFNIVGQNVAELNTQAFRGKTKFSVSWDISNYSNLSTGVYIVSMATPRIRKSIKITYLK